MFGFFQNRRNLFLLIFFVLICVCGLFIGYKINEQKNKNNLIEQTSFQEVSFVNQWPLQIVNNHQNDYLVRVVVKPEIHLGRTEFNGYLIESWNYGLIKDAKGRIQEIAIPRSWYNIQQQRLFFLGSTTPIEIDAYSPDYIFGTVAGIDNFNQLKQRLAAAYIAPSDPDLDQSLLEFFENLTQSELPSSFIQSGDVDDLPKATKIGPFLPITQLMFDLQK